MHTPDWHDEDLRSQEEKELFMEKPEAESGIKGIVARSLRQCRQFYMTHPEIWQTLSAKL